MDFLKYEISAEIWSNVSVPFLHLSQPYFQWATLFDQLKIGQLFFGQLNLVNYLMQIRLDLEGLKI